MSIYVSCFETSNVLTFNHVLLPGCFSELSVPSRCIYQCLQSYQESTSPPLFKEATTCSEGVERPARVPAHVSSVRVVVVDVVNWHLLFALIQKEITFAV